MEGRQAPKPLKWVGSSRKDLKAFPKKIRRDFGLTLYAAQCGEEYPSVKALKGFGGRSVLEIISIDDTNTFRAVYTVRFRDAIYVLHAFQKKSKKGMATPKPHIELINRRLSDVERLHKEKVN